MGTTVHTKFSTHGHAHGQLLVAVHAAVPMQDSCVHSRMHLGRGRSQEEVLAELILVLEFPACESSAAVLVVLKDTDRKS